MNILDYIFRLIVCNIRSLFCNYPKVVEDLIKSDKFDDFSWLYNRLSQQNDREFLSKIVARRLLSPVQMQLCDPEKEYHLFRNVKKEFLKDIRHCNKCLFDRGWTLYLMNMSKYGVNVDFFVNDIVILYSFIKKQYEYREVGIYPKLGDIVIDAGGCYGDTALTFATMVGDSGKVYSFEMNKSNIEMFKKNCKSNADLLKRVQLIEKPLYSKEGVEFFVEEKRAGSTISSVGSETTGSCSVRSCTIDSFMTEFNLKKLDFIKMDIEGAELDALYGARNSIKSYKPQMALSVYHKRRDLDDIPRFVHKLVPEYKFFLKQHSCSDLETVLYCTT